MFVLGSTILSPDRPFTANGIKYPANWLRLSTAAEREALGVQEVPDPPTWDQRFFWGYGSDGALIPKDHVELVALWTKTTRTTANTLLAPTDWIVIREIDNGQPADTATKNWREAIRQASDAKVISIESTTDTAELAAYVTSSDYHAWPQLQPAEPAAEAARN